MASEMIISLQNDRIKRLVKLRERKHRDAEGVMLLDELRIVERAFDARFGIVEVYFCSELTERHPRATPLIDRLREAGAEVIETTRPVMEKAAYRQNPEGVLAVATTPQISLADLELPDSPLLLVLENVEKPGNLGAVVRTASGAGVHGVLACGVGADPWNPNCLRSSTGAVFTVPTVVAERDDIAAWLKEQGVRTIAAALGDSIVHTDIDMKGPTALLLGAEDRGLTPALLAAADLCCRIPMEGSADSLNVSVAAAVLAYEALRQRTRS